MKREDAEALGAALTETCARFGAEFHLVVAHTADQTMVFSPLPPAGVRELLEKLLALHGPEPEPALKIDLRGKRT